MVIVGTFHSSNIFPKIQCPQHPLTHPTHPPLYPTRYSQSGLLGEVVPRLLQSALPPSPQPWMTGKDCVLCSLALSLSGLQQGTAGEVPPGNRLLNVHGSWGFPITVTPILQTRKLRLGCRSL